MQITDLPQRGVIAVYGKDAKTFLQGQLTCDLNIISPTHSSFGAQCNLQGRVHSLFRLIESKNRDEPCYYLMMPKVLLSKALEGLKKYALFSKVKIESLEDIVALGIQGQNAQSILSAISSDAWYCDIPGEESRYEIYGKADALDSIKANLPSQTIRINSNNWDQDDITAKIPEIYPETVDQFLPHHVGLVELGGVSFDKGCYLGQEIVARMQWRGNIKKHLYRGVISTHAPKAGELLYDNPESSGESIGEIVRFAAINTNDYKVLIVLKDGTKPYYAGSPIILD